MMAGLRPYFHVFTRIIERFEMEKYRVPQMASLEWICLFWLQCRTSLMYHCSSILYWLMWEIVSCVHKACGNQVFLSLKDRLLCYIFFMFYIKTFITGVCVCLHIDVPVSSLMKCSLHPCHWTESSGEGCLKVEEMEQLIVKRLALWFPLPHTPPLPLYFNRATGCEENQRHGTHKTWCLLKHGWKQILATLINSG